MIIQLSELRTFTKSRNTPDVSKFSASKTVFLSHSHLDQDLVVRLVQLFAEQGWGAYVDWMDGSMPDKPNAATAAKIKSRIERCAYFLYLATPNSAKSRWCPWEIGFADKARGQEKVLIIPTQDQSGATLGAEYLDLYRRIEVNQVGLLDVMDAQTNERLLLKNL